MCKESFVGSILVHLSSKSNKRSCHVWGNLFKEEVDSVLLGLGCFEEVLDSFTLPDWAGKNVFWGMGKFILSSTIIMTLWCNTKSNHSPSDPGYARLQDDKHQGCMASHLPVEQWHHDRTHLLHDGFQPPKAHSGWIRPLLAGDPPVQSRMRTAKTKKQKWTDPGQNICPKSPWYSYHHFDPILICHCASTWRVEDLSFSRTVGKLQGDFSLLLVCQCGKT